MPQCMRVCKRVCAYVSVSCASNVLRICSLSGFLSTHTHSHTHTIPERVALLALSPSASRFCSRFYPSTNLLIGNIFTFCGMCSLWHSPVSSTGVNKCTSTRGSHRCGRGVVAPRRPRLHLLWVRNEKLRTPYTYWACHHSHKPPCFEHVIKCTCCFVFYSCHCRIYTIATSPNKANYKEDVTCSTL